jgi:hypothetical protein
MSEKHNQTKGNQKEPAKSTQDQPRYTMWIAAIRGKWNRPTNKMARRMDQHNSRQLQYQTSPLQES